MVKHNNVVPNVHAHKAWQTRVKTWFHQAAQKKARRQKRKVKAAAIAPRPAAGPLRPAVHCPTQKYHMKVRLGRGFTLEELRAAGISPKLARSIGIAVDHRRTNHSQESLQTNVQRLKEYKARLIVFPRKANKPRAGDASKEELAKATQLTGEIIPLAKPAGVQFVTVTDEMKAFNAHSTLRIARNDARLKGIREKKAKSGDQKQDVGGDDA